MRGGVKRDRCVAPPVGKSGDGRAAHVTCARGASISALRRPLANANQPPFSDPAPVPLVDISGSFDPQRYRVLLFGGIDGSACNGVWALDLDPTPAWNLLSPSGTAPPPRSQHSAIYDPGRDAMIVFGGHPND